MAKRKIIKIDEEKCDGCGLCVPSCAEGAIKIVDGKAKLVSETFCDGLGACLGECPQNAIKIEEREAAEFNQADVEKYLQSQGNQHHSGHHHAEKQPEPEFTCPSARIMQMDRSKTEKIEKVESKEILESALTHWPVKLRLVPPTAPFLSGKDLLLVADCVPFSFPDLHGKFLKDKSVIIGCPKFDDYETTLTKLTEICRQSGIKSLTVVHMEVPCCHFYWKTAQEAIDASGIKIPLSQAVISIGGEIKFINASPDQQSIHSHNKAI